MFPFNENPISVLRTSSDVEQFGRQALLRALNIGRVVAFVGSGTSLKFGQPAWTTFADRGLKLFYALETAIMAHDLWNAFLEGKKGVAAKDKKSFEFVREFRLKLSPLVDEIKDLSSCKGLEPSHLVELIEDYFAEVCPLLERHGLKPDDLVEGSFATRRKIAIKKQAGRPKDEKERKEWEDRHFGPVVDEDDDPLELSFSISEFRREFAKQFDIVERSKRTALSPGKSILSLVSGLGIKTDNIAKQLDDVKEDISNIDVARTLRRRLGVRRFLTLNYDLELEMMLFEEGRATPTEVYKNFEEFLLQSNSGTPNELSYEPGRAVTLDSPSGRVLRSSSSRKETLADLFSFGAFPTNYDASVHHLHGRIDDPENMVITPKDYQRIYYGASDQKKSFDEARHAVFTGSDVLVLGMGTSEQDVLKPLRDFLELEADRRDAYGNVYYITAAEFSGKDTSLKEALRNAQRDAKAKTQSLYKDYRMHTLFFDLSFETERTRSWTNESASCFAARAEIANYLHLLKGDELLQPWDKIDTTKAFKELFGEVYIYTTDENPGSKIKLTDCLEVTLARDLVRAWRRIRSKKGKNEKRGVFEKAFKALDAHLRDTGLVHFAKHLEESRRAWWSDWSQVPGFRIAVLGQHNYELKPGRSAAEQARAPEFLVTEKKRREPLVWRQTNLDAYFHTPTLVLGETDDTPQFTGLLAATAFARSKAQNRVSELVEEARDRNDGSPIDDDIWKDPPGSTFPASVARISIPPGGGKGRLLTYFTTKQSAGGSTKKIWPFQTLFGSDLQCKRLPNAGYKACFMSHLTLALEFSGTMIAFARLLQNLLPQLCDEAKKASAYPDEFDVQPWEALQDHQFQRQSGAESCIKVLRDMFVLFQRTCPPGGWKKTRMVAIFSYLDRLVDENGDAYSPTHRAFFRLISGWNDQDAHMRLPIDLVFINCHADQPIRYLSIEEPIDLRVDQRRDDRWKASNWCLRHDRGIALENWTELKRVRPKIIFLEALEHQVGFLGDSKHDLIDYTEWLEKALQMKEDEYDFLPLPSNIKKFMYRRVANGHFLAGLATTIRKKTGDNVADFRTEWDRCISALDIAFAREKSKGLIDELLGIYRRLDREIDAPGPKQELSRIGSSEQTRLKERLRTMTIDHLALIQVPATPSTLLACPDVASVVKVIERKGGETDLDVLTAELNSLVGRGLASRYVKFSDRIAGKNRPARKGTYVYVLNTKVASVLRARANLEVYSQYRLMVFQPNAYPSQPERALKPDMIHFERVSAVVRALVKTTHQEMVITYWKMRRDKSDWKDADAAEFVAMMEGHNDKLRAAYALIRGTFSISVIARLSESAPAHKRLAPFDEYRTWTRKLLNAATLLRKIRELDIERRLTCNVGSNSNDALPYNHPFLRDEVSWLYNERALVSFVQGRLFDALPLFEQASAMLGSSSERSSPQSEGASNRRIQMNYALAQIERGNIVTAQATLERIVTESDARWKSDTPSVINCMARGFTSLCHHLTNEFTRAKDGYEKVLMDIGQFNHPRAESIFRRHYADLLRAMSTSRNDLEYKEAISNLRSSEELALGIRATDLNHYAIMAQARLHRDMQERGRALESLRRVEEYARSMGIQKMLCEVLKVRGEVLLAEGETTQAGFVTAQSIAISKRNGMRLRKISAAIIQARILRHREQVEDANRLLSETITESQALGYATKTSQAFNLLKRS